MEEILGGQFAHTWKVFFVGNTVYFILSEEPELARRFGEDYERYCANLRRWWPRLTPWEQEE